MNSLSPFDVIDLLKAILRCAVKNDTQSLSSLMLVCRLWRDALLETRNNMKWDKEHMIEERLYSDRISEASDLVLPCNGMYVEFIGRYTVAQCTCCDSVVVFNEYHCQVFKGVLYSCWGNVFIDTRIGVMLVQHYDVCTLINDRVERYSCNPKELVAVLHEGVVYRKKGEIRLHQFGQNSYQVLEGLSDKVEGIRYAPGYLVYSCDGHSCIYSVKEDKIIRRMSKCEIKIAGRIFTIGNDAYDIETGKLVHTSVSRIIEASFDYRKKCHVLWT